MKTRKKLVIAIIIASTILALGAFGTYFAFVFFKNTPSIEEVENINIIFFEAVESREWQEAKSMLDGPVMGQTSIETLQGFFSQPNIKPIVDGYERLRVCDWGVFATPQNQEIRAEGIIDYNEQDLVMFTSTLIQSDDNKWRISNFEIHNNIEDVEPFGRCN